MKKHLNRIFTAFLCILMLASMAGCGKKEEPAKTEPSGQTGEPAQTEELAQASWKPEKTVNVIVGFAAGGGMDSLARAVANYIDLDGQTMYVTNVEGGGGNIGGMEAYHSDNDGYTIIIMKHQKRRFVEHVDYITSPGWGDGPEGRQKDGLNPCKGPRAVITELGILRFDETSRRMYLAEYYPGITPEQIQENTGFQLDLSRAVQAEPPEAAVLEVLVNQVDPMRIMI